MKTKTILASTITLALGGLIAWWGQAAATEKHENTGRLEGAWTVTAHVEGEPLIHALITFNSDGGFVETAAAPGVSSGHGNWARTGHRKFALTAVYLRLDATGQFIGSSRVRSSFAVNERSDTATGPFQTDVFDAAGNMLFSFGGTAEATRIAVEPLQ